MTNWNFILAPREEKKIILIIISCDLAREEKFLVPRALLPGGTGKPKLGKSALGTRLRIRPIMLVLISDSWFSRVNEALNSGIYVLFELQVTYKRCCLVY